MIAHAEGGIAPTSSNATNPALSEVVTKWRREQHRFAGLGAMVDGSKLIDQLLHDIERATAMASEEAISLAAAAQESGYSSSHVARLIREGRIENVGRPHAPRVRRGDLPRKPPTLRPPGPSMQLLGAGPGQVARAIVAREKEAR